MLAVIAFVYAVEMLSYRFGSATGKLFRIIPAVPASCRWRIDIEAGFIADGGN
jgi:hypothetical protein